MRATFPIDQRFACNVAARYMERLKLLQDSVPAQPIEYVHGLTVFLTKCILAEMPVLVGGSSPPAPVVLTSTRMSARNKRIQERSSHVNVYELAFLRILSACMSATIKVVTQRSLEPLFFKGTRYACFSVMYITRRSHGHDAPRYVYELLEQEWGARSMGTLHMDRVA